MNESNKQKGWIKLYRSITDNAIWDEKPFSRGQAWIDLLLMANHEERYVGGTKVEAGSFITSMQKLAERWGWSRSAVIRYMNRTQSEHMVILKADSKRTLVTVVNWALYQSDRTQTEHKADSKRTQTELKADTNKNKEEEEEKEYENRLVRPTDDPLFETFWKAYPKKVGKEDARKAWKKIRPGQEFADQILKAVINNRANNPQWQREGGRFIPNPSTWLNQGRWQDEFMEEKDVRHYDDRPPIS